MAFISAVAAFACAGTAGAPTALAVPPTTVSVSPGSNDFGSAQVGFRTAATTLTLTNTGAVDLVIAGFGLTAASVNLTDFTAVAGGTCSKVVPVAAGGSCTALVRFNPTALGARSGLFRFYINTVSGRIDIPLAGTGVAAPAATVTPGGFDFGLVAVDSSVQTTLTLTNTGGANLTIAGFGITAASSNPGDFTAVLGGTCSKLVPVAAGDSCTALVRFKPLIAGARTAIFRFYVNTPAGYVDTLIGGLGDDACTECL